MNGLAITLSYLVLAGACADENPRYVFERFRGEESTSSTGSSWSSLPTTDSTYASDSDTLKIPLSQSIIFVQRNDSLTTSITPTSQISLDGSTREYSPITWASSCTSLSNLDTLSIPSASALHTTASPANWTRYVHPTCCTGAISDTVSNDFHYSAAITTNAIPNSNRTRQFNRTTTFSILSKTIPISPLRTVQPYGSTGEIVTNRSSRPTFTVNATIRSIPIWSNTTCSSRTLANDTTPMTANNPMITDTCMSRLPLPTLTSENTRMSVFNLSVSNTASHSSLPSSNSTWRPCRSTTVVSELSIARNVTITIPFTQTTFTLTLPASATTIVKSSQKTCHSTSPASVNASALSQLSSNTTGLGPFFSNPNTVSRTNSVVITPTDSTVSLTTVAATMTHLEPSTITATLITATCNTRSYNIYNGTAFVTSSPLIDCVYRACVSSTCFVRETVMPLGDTSNILFSPIATESLDMLYTSHALTSRAAGSTMPPPGGSTISRMPGKFETLIDSASSLSCSATLVSAAKTASIPPLLTACSNDTSSTSILYSQEFTGLKFSISLLPRPSNNTFAGPASTSSSSHGNCTSETDLRLTPVYTILPPLGPFLPPTSIVVTPSPYGSIPISAVSSVNATFAGLSHTQNLSIIVTASGINTVVAASTTAEDSYIAGARSTTVGAGSTFTTIYFAPKEITRHRVRYDHTLSSSETISSLQKRNKGGAKSGMEKEEKRARITDEAQWG